MTAPRTPVTSPSGSDVQKARRGGYVSRERAARLAAGGEDRAAELLARSPRCGTCGGPVVSGAATHATCPGPVDAELAELLAAGQRDAAELLDRLREMGFSDAHVLGGLRRLGVVEDGPMWRLGVSA